MKKIFKVQIGNRSFTMISMEDITESEAARFVHGKWPGAKVK